MVGVFTRLARGVSGDQRSALQQAIEENKAASLKDVLGSGALDLMEDFAPVEHPIEPPNNDKPVRCPPPEPCIVHDGRLWKERITKLRGDYPLARENSLPSSYQRRPKLEPSNYLLPSFSAPEKQMLKMLEDAIPKL